MWISSGGNRPLFFSGSATLWPSRMLLRPSSMALLSTELLTTCLTMSSACSSGMPPISSVESVRAKRASATFFSSLPKYGMRSSQRSKRKRPAGVRIDTRTAITTAMSTTPTTAHQ